MKRILTTTILLILLLVSSLYSQKDEVNKYLRLVAYGRLDEVRAAIPDLLAKYPNDPGIKLLHGTILDDAYLALDIYSNIVTNHSESQWADHAYWRIIQFYALLGDTVKAQTELNNLRSKYPASTFIGPSSDVVRSAYSLMRKDKKSIVKSPELIPNKVENNSTATASVSQKPVSQTITKHDAVINPDINAATTELKTNKKIDTEKKAAEPDKLKPLVNEHNKPTAEKLKINDNQHTANTVINPKEEKKEKQVEDIEEPKFFGLQVGIYKDKNTAEAEKNKFLVRRLRTQVVEKNVNGVIMYAVVIGHYSSIESAEEGKKIVSIQCGCEPIIYTK